MRANAFCVLIKAARRHARKLPHTHVRTCVCIFAWKQTQTHADTIYIHAHTYTRLIIYRRSGFDCEILLLRIASFPIIHNQKNSRKKNAQLMIILYCPLGNSQSLKSQSGLYSAIRNRLTTQSKPDLQYTRTQFAQTNGPTTRTHVYIINASNAMSKPYLYTYAHAVDREQYLQTNANTGTQTHANSSLRSTRGRFLRANAFAFCALDLKLSGCTIAASVPNITLQNKTGSESAI